MSSNTHEWQGKVLTEEAVRAVPGAPSALIVEGHVVVTPLAREAMARRGLRLERRSAPGISPASSNGWQWVAGLESNTASAVMRQFPEIAFRDSATPFVESAWMLVKEISEGKRKGAIAFGREVESLCILANQLPRLFAVAPSSIAMATRVADQLEVNFVGLAQEWLTFHEMARIIRLFTQRGQGPRPKESLGRILREVQTHANR